MEEHGHLSENNLAVLKDVLSDVHRVDLIQKIEKFTITEGKFLWDWVIEIKFLWKFPHSYFKYVAWASLMVYYAQPVYH